jgi:hypothetical protein
MIGKASSSASSMPSVFGGGLGMRSLTALFLLLCASVSLSTRASASEIQIDRGVRNAFLFAYPVYQIARTRAEAIASARAAGRDVVNRFGHRARLAGPLDRAVTTPNNDTLYSSAWLDLNAGPVVLTVPTLPTRYHSVALMDVFTDNFAVLGTRTNRGRGGLFLITGPNWSGRVPRGMKRITAPTNDVWALVRVLVDGPTDLATAAAAQSGFAIRTLSPASVPTPTPASLSRTPDPRRLLAGASAFLARNPLHPARAKRAKELDAFGIATDGLDHWDALEPQVRESWTRQLPGLLVELRAGFGKLGSVQNGWSYPPAGMGRFGEDDFYRAVVALGGLAALPREEAIYLTAGSDTNGAALDGQKHYRLTIPAKLPLSGFWSLSMYEVAPDGRLFFTANSIARYAISDRTVGLIRNGDGSVTIKLQPDSPMGADAGNWLPTPRGPFRMTFRAYLPRPALQSGTFILAGIIPISDPAF